jgi:hypothetical protein
MNTQLTQSQWEDLSAYFDGELTGPQADRIARLIETDPAWQRAHASLAQLSARLDAWAVPAPPAELAGRIGQAVARQSRTLRLRRWLVPAAAAAVVLLVASLHMLLPGAGPGDILPDRFVRDNAELFTAEPTRPVADAQAILSDDLRQQLLATSPVEPPAAIDSDRWNRLSPAQQQVVRQRAKAFLEMTAAEQQALLAEYEQADPLTDSPARQQQARWMNRIIESFTPAERQALLEMTPAERAEAFLRQRDKLNSQR